jgi:nitrogen fixation/metabolism regulation signal transduction histidine kinase
MSKKVQQGDSDSKQLASMAASQKAISETQAKMATDLAVQQNMIEEARDRERHRDRRIERLEEGVARAHPGFRPHRRATAEATE